MQLVLLDSSIIQYYKVQEVRGYMHALIKVQEVRGYMHALILIWSCNANFGMCTRFPNQFGYMHALSLFL